MKMPLRIYVSGQQLRQDKWHDIGTSDELTIWSLSAVQLTILTVMLEIDLPFQSV